jgi:nitrogen regulatory protein PII
LEDIAEMVNRYIIRTRIFEETQMSVENHRHCQATVLSANGTGNQNGATWHMINALNLPNVKPENWLEQFKNNRENITQDIVATLTLIN